MNTPPPSWEVIEEERPQLAELQAPTYLEPWMGELLAAAEITVPRNRTFKFFQNYEKAEVVSHRNRSGRLELKVKFDEKPATSVWLEQLLECHRKAAAHYFHHLARGHNQKKSWNALSRKFPEVVELAEEFQW